MILSQADIEEKIKTVLKGDVSPQEEWWQKNLLIAYLEITWLRHECQRLRQQLYAEINR